MPITISKEHEGKTVYGLGTGNNCPRGNTPNNPIEFFVEKVNRKYVKLIRDGFRGSANYCPKTGGTQEEINRGYNNEGYLFFESLEDIDNYNEVNRIKGNIHSFFRQMNPELTEGQARTIHAILFPDA